MLVLHVPALILSKHPFSTAFGIITDLPMKRMISFSEDLTIPKKAVLLG